MRRKLIMVGLLVLAVSIGWLIWPAGPPNKAAEQVSMGVSNVSTNAEKRITINCRVVNPSKVTIRVGGAGLVVNEQLPFQPVRGIKMMLIQPNQSYSFQFSAATPPSRYRLGIWVYPEPGPAAKFLESIVDKLRSLGLILPRYQPGFSEGAMRYTDWID